MTLYEIMTSDFLVRVILRGLAVGLLVSLCSAVLGVSLVLKRYSMIGDGLSHVGFFGLALASAAGVGSLYSMEISIPVVILSAVLILRLSRGNGRLNGDAACAVVSTGAVAVGTLLYNVTGGRSGDICSSLFGSSSVFTISGKDMILSLLLSAAVLLWFVLSFKTIFSVTFDETFARAAGVKTNLYGLTLSVLTGMTIVVGMKMMGSIMISALLIFPPLTAMRITGNFRRTVILSAVISAASFTVGYLVTCAVSLGETFAPIQTGAAVVTVNLLVFCAVYGIAWLRGRIRQKRTGMSAEAV
ncbi:MAG: metal ABC transporter permease [Clostridia bacterium]|nr:metal ABC transporter permease [Clostridia bacterium]MBQ5354912.1 metal ABC transporter permease [Clostridia bacterium]